MQHGQITAGESKYSAFISIFLTMENNNKEKHWKYIQYTEYTA